MTMQHHARTYVYVEFSVRKEVKANSFKINLQDYVIISIFLDKRHII